MHKGKIVSLTVDTITIEHISRAAGLAHTDTYTVDPAVAVTLDGQPAQFTDLMPGDSVSLSGTPVKRITAKR